jgi:DNA polymerase-3 subunit beta
MNTAVLEKETTNSINDFNIRFELVVNKTALLKALSHVQSVVEKRNIVPILSNIKFTCKEDALSLTATDMDLAVTEEIKANIIFPGSLTISAHTIYEIVKKLPEGSDVKLATDKDAPGKLEITAGSCRFSLPFLPAHDFPVMETGEMPNNFSLSAINLKKMIDKTRFSISTEETRYNLNGLYFHVAENNESSILRVVSTDGHRLSLIETELPNGAEGMPGVIIPRKTINEIKKIIDDGVGEVAISLSSTKIIFTYNNVVLVSKLIDGNFPEYENLIPYNNDKIMHVNTELFTEAVDRVSTISIEKFRSVKMSLVDGSLTVSATGDDSGSAIEEVQVEYNNSSIEIGFNSRYLLEVASVIEGADIEFRIIDSFSPVMIKDLADLSATYVVMPMRV